MQTTKQGRPLGVLDSSLPLPAEQTEKLYILRCRHSLRALAAILQISTTTLQRALDGGRLARATRALIAESLDRQAEI